MPQVVIDNPILNSAFDEPARHFQFGDEGIQRDCRDTPNQLVFHSDSTAEEEGDGRFPRKADMGPIFAFLTALTFFGGSAYGDEVSTL